MIRWQMKSLEHGDYPARGFRDGSIFDEERPPYGIGLIALGERPVLLGRGVGRSEEFSFEIMIGQQLVDAPQPELAECRSKQVRVNVDELRGREHILHSRRNLRFCEKIAISGDRKLAR